MFINPNEAHCIFCGCPKDIWKPLDTYLSNRSCEFYSDVWDVGWDLEKAKGYITYQGLLRTCAKLKNNYRDIPDYEAAVSECFDIFEDCGVFKIKGGKLKII